MRRLIVNADDFGLSAGVNRGVAIGHEQGIVTSASLMVRRDAAPEAALYATTHPELSVGLHLDLGEWVYGDGEWNAVVEPPVSIADEARIQLEIFRDFMGRNPTHLDSHQHVHFGQTAASALGALASELGVPLRGHDAQIAYRGDFYGQTAHGTPCPDAISVDGLLKVLGTLPPGCTELGCHPGVGDDLDTMYCSERVEEVKVLCDPRVRTSIVAMGIELRSFLNLPACAVGVMP
jgi:predicted glycoside hydrolase/deacetylase ChbG (UPF0249 family)